MIYFILFVAFLVAAVSQLLWRHGMQRESALTLMTRVLVVGLGCIGYLISTFLGVYCMRFIPLKSFAVGSASVFPFVAVGAHVFLKERLTESKIVGTGFICLGIIVAFCF